MEHKDTQQGSTTADGSSTRSGSVTPRARTPIRNPVPSNQGTYQVHFTTTSVATGEEKQTILNSQRPNGHSGDFATLEEANQAAWEHMAGILIDSGKSFLVPPTRQTLDRARGLGIPFEWLTEFKKGEGLLKFIGEEVLLVAVKVKMVEVLDSAQSLSPA